MWRLQSKKEHKLFLDKTSNWKLYKMTSTIYSYFLSYCHCPCCCTDSPELKRNELNWPWFSSKCINRKKSNIEAFRHCFRFVKVFFTPMKKYFAQNYTPVVLVLFSFLIYLQKFCKSKTSDKKETFPKSCTVTCKKQIRDVGSSEKNNIFCSCYYCNWCINRS